MLRVPVARTRQRLFPAQAEATADAAIGTAPAARTLAHAGAAPAAAAHGANPVDARGRHARPSVIDHHHPARERGA